MNDWQTIVVTLISGGLGGVALSQIWTRVRKRMSTLRWTSYQWDIASALDDKRIGRLELFYNGQAADNIQGCKVDIENQSNSDLRDVEITLFSR